MNILLNKIDKRNKNTNNKRIYNNKIKKKNNKNNKIMKI